jgi:DeoR family transcriptional regulator, fructose operon transcriptional repressor
LGSVTRRVSGRARGNPAFAADPRPKPARTPATSAPDAAPTPAAERSGSSGKQPRRSVVERRQRIVALARERGVVRAFELVELLGVTDETVRRDLAYLDEAGAVRRLHGGAVAEQLRNEPSFDWRHRKHQAEKAAIAHTAAGYVTPGSTIIVDSGSTTVHLAKELKDTRDLVVVTNAVTNAVELMGNPNITVVLIGGMIRPTTFGSVGPMAVANLNELRVDQVYLAISGISFEGGLTDSTFEEAAVKRAMIAAASEVILLVDSSKFGRDSMVRVAPLEAISRVVTDAGIDPEAVSRLRGLGVEVVIASTEGVSAHEGQAGLRERTAAG